MLDRIREAIVSFHKELGREQFLYHTGRNLTLELEPVYDRAADLLRRDTLENLNRLCETTPEEFSRKRHGVRRLASYTESHYVQKALLDLTQRMRELERTTEFRVGGDRLPVFKASWRMSIEPDPRLRQSINSQFLDALADTDGLCSEWLSQCRSEALTLGYQTPWAMVSAWHVSSLDGLASEAERFLDLTKEVYERHIDAALKGTIEFVGAMADSADIRYFRQCLRYADHFPANQFRRVFDETLENIGIPSEKSNNIEIDDVARPGKHARTLCFPICLPDEISVSIDPRAGPNIYQSMLQAGGTAQSYAWTSPLLPPEFGISGDAGVFGGYGYLFVNLVLDPSWLNEALLFKDSEGFVRLQWIQRLFHFRRQAALLLFERELYQSCDLAEAGRRYQCQMTEATRFQHHAEEVYLLVDDLAKVAHDFRAGMFEVQLREYLRTRFGRKWWKIQRVADTLIDLWNVGGEYPAEELALLADLGGASPDHMAGEFIEALTDK